MSKDYDPAMHSAEHILNQTMVRKFKSGRSFSNHIEKKKSKCDYHFNRDLSPEDILEIEEKVNFEIRKNHTVFEEFLPREEAEKYYYLERLLLMQETKSGLLKLVIMMHAPAAGFMLRILLK